MTIRIIHTPPDTGASLYTDYQLVMNKLEEEGVGMLDQLTALDLVIHVERLRAVNDVTAHDNTLEDACLEVLDYAYRTDTRLCGL